MPGRSALPGVPGIYVVLFCDVLRALDCDDAALLDELGLRRSDLLGAEARVSMEVAARLTERALALAGGEGLGFRYAAAMKITLHGAVGLLALSSPTVRDAIDAATRFVSLRAPFLAFSWHREGSLVVLEVLPAVPLGGHHAMIMEAMTMGLVYMMQQLDPHVLADAEVWLEGEQPAYYPRLARSLPVPVRYGAARSQMRASAALLDRTPQLADPSVAALAREQCEAELRKLFAVPATLGDEVRRRLEAVQTGAPTLDATAKTLGLSPRTLRRRLQEEGTSYTALVDEALHARSERLVRESDLPIAEIAFRAGYSDVSNFTRAFRRWTGRTPRALRAR